MNFSYFSLHNFPILFFVLLSVIPAFSSSSPIPCPCSDQSLCAPLGPLPDRKEIFGFSVNATQWIQYDFSRITTIAIVSGILDPPLLCRAHSNNVRLVWSTSFPANQLLNDTAKQLWINDSIQKVIDTYTDGLNIDTEDPMGEESAESIAYTELIAELNRLLKQKLPNAQLTIDVAWSPNCIDGRCYDYKQLSDHSDYLYIMSYDLRSQIFPPSPCIASANSPIDLVKQGFLDYLTLDIPANKLILGVPNYGYDYPCLSNTSPTDKICQIKSIPFRGAPCSDAAGEERSYRDLMNQIKTATTPPRFDEELGALTYNYLSSSDNLVHQVWMDDFKALTIKYRLAKSLGAIGLGPWTFDFIDYSNPGEVDTYWKLYDEFLNDD